MISNRIHIGLFLTMLSVLLFSPTEVNAQLIETSDPVPSEAQIMMHLEEMMDTWEIETALKKNGRQNFSESTAMVPVDGGKLPMQLRSVQGAMPFQSGPRVKAFIQRFTQEKRKETEAVLGLTKAYGPLVDHEIRKRKLPHNLRYLPAALSAYNTLAVSDRGSAGLWQLPYHTALRYGLECGRNIDERRDPIQSTSAALDYIGDLFKQFKSWDLTILAYTCGPANVNKAMNRSREGHQFASLYPLLPRHSRDFWPAFIAMNYLGQYYRTYQLNPLVVELPIIKETVTVEKKLGFKAISDVLDIPRNHLKALNPTYRENVVCLDGENGRLCLPVEYLGAFKAKKGALYAKAMEETPPAPSEPEVEVVNKTPKTPSVDKKPVKSPVPANSTALKYTIQPGDNLGKIAETYGVRVSQLQSWNGISGTRINAGDQLLVHVPKGKTNSFKDTQVHKSPKTPQVNPPKASGKTQSYTVQSGDTLWGISQKYQGVSADDIMAANNISEDIQPGQILKIPASK